MTGSARSALDILKHQSMVSRGSKYASILRLVQNCPDELFEQEFNAFRDAMKPGVLLNEIKNNPSIKNDVLQIAVRRHLVQGVNVLLKNGVILNNERNIKYNVYPIMDSVITTSPRMPVEIVKTLLEAGMNPNYVGETGIHALARYLDREDILFVLFDHGADIDGCFKKHSQMAGILKNSIIESHQRWIASRAERLNVTPAKRLSRSL